MVCHLKTHVALHSAADSGSNPTHFEVAKEPLHHHEWQKKLDGVVVVVVEAHDSESEHAQMLLQKDPMYFVEWQGGSYES